MSIDATRFVWKLSKDIISPIEKLILLAIADRCGERGECWPSISRLAKDTLLHRDTIIQHRKRFIEIGILRLTGEMRGRGNQIPVMQLMIDNWREGDYVEDEIDQSLAPTSRPERLAPVVGADRYQSLAPTQNLKEEPKEEPKIINNKKNVIPIDYPESYYPLPQEKKLRLTAEDVLIQNPHNIPISMIEDWLANRKAKKSPLTQTAWNRLNKELAKCANPLDAFEQMVAAGWQGFKAEWVSAEKKSKLNDDLNWKLS